LRVVALPQPSWRNERQREEAPRLESAIIAYRVVTMSSLDALLKQIDDPSELSWKDETYDLALASGLDAAERTQLISRLIDAARQDDQRAVLTLGYIGARETVPALLPLARADN